jgi:hypothetical protein
MAGGWRWPLGAICGRHPQIRPLYVGVGPDLEDAWLKRPSIVKIFEKLLDLFSKMVYKRSGIGA